MIEHTISQADVRLTDIASTDLEGKGTGIRGGLLVAMLKYISDESRRSLFLAVEEPETFLHPAAQEQIREDLQELGRRSDVTLLVTTHSPFVIPRGPEAQVISLAKGFVHTSPRAVLPRLTTSPPKPSPVQYPRGDPNRNVALVDVATAFA